jgi:uncharacterized membrane protein YphA (DoxX/SURF4 family)
MTRMNFLVWTLQVALAAINALHGWLFATWSPAMEKRMQQRRPGAKPFALPPAFRTFIGVAELAAAVGLILPAATGILPWLTPLAAAGFAVVMAGAVVLHLSRQEQRNVVSSVVLCLLAVFVAVMRWRLGPR